MMEMTWLLMWLNVSEAPFSLKNSNKQYTSPHELSNIPIFAELLFLSNHKREKKKKTFQRIKSSKEKKYLRGNKHS